MGQDLVLIGAGGCMRELLWQIEELNDKELVWNVIGYVDKQPYQSGNTFDISVGDIYCPYLGDDEYLLSFQQATNVAISVGEPELRKKIAQKLMNNSKLKFPNLIMGDTRICQDMKIGQGCIVSMGCRVSTNVVLGDFVFLNIDSLICHDGKVGNFSTLSPNVKIAGRVTIGNECMIGLGSKVKQEVTIGDRVIAGAGSVIVKDIESDCIVAGIPAKPMKNNCDRYHS